MRNVPGPDVDGKRVGVPDEEETIRAVRRVGGIIDDDALAAECIADLPAEEIDASAPDGSRKGLAQFIVLLDRALPYTPPALQDEIRTAILDASAL